MKLPVAYYGDSVLRKKGVPVAEVNDEIRQLVADMIETMHVHNGMGLAAQQVHKTINLFITEVPIPNPNYNPEVEGDERWLPGKLRVFINPKILSYSQEEWICGEACVSIPKLQGDVTRPVGIRVKATDLDGNEFEAEFSGMEARCIMHENDHINGVLYIDRVKGKQRKELEPQLREVKRKYSSGK